MYVCTYVVVVLRYLDSGMQVSSWHPNHEDSVSLSTLKIDGQAYDALRACRARAATVHVKMNSSKVGISVPQSSSHYLYTCKHVVRPHLCTWCARHDADTYS